MSDIPKSLNSVPESPLRPLFERICTCTTYIAPERASDLQAALKGLPVHCTVDVQDGNAGISVDPMTCNVTLPLAQLERLWAMTYGFLTAYREGRKYFPRTEITVQEAPELQVPLQLVSWASKGFRVGERLDWPTGLPRPDAPGGDGEHVECINRFFVGAVAFILLHEIAHHLLNHPSPMYQSDDESMKCELEADRWSGDWILEKCPNDEKIRIFRGNCCVLSLSMINLIEVHFRSNAGRKTHPPVAERILAFLSRHFAESAGPSTVSTDFPIYLAALILHVQRINLGFDSGAGESHASIIDYLIDALRAFQTD
jgi:hypothetical protein